MNEKQAYEAMIVFLDKYYSRGKDDAIGSLLGCMMLMSDGSSADPAMWHDWLESVDEIMKEDD